MANAATDFELLDRWGVGDRGAGEELVQRHHGTVLRLFQGKADDAIGDLVKRTFEACFARRMELPRGGLFRAFLLGIARAELIAHLERRHRRVDPLQDSVAKLVPPASIRPAPTPEHHRLATALRELPLDHQLAVELFHWEDLSVAELAGMLRVSERTVRSRLLARDPLRARLADGEAAQLDDASFDAWIRSLREHLTPTLVD